MQRPVCVGWGKDIATDFFKVKIQLLFWYFPRFVIWSQWTTAIMTLTLLFYQHKNSTHFLLKIAAAYSFSLAKYTDIRTKHSGKKLHSGLLHSLLSPQRCPCGFHIVCATRGCLETGCHSPLLWKSSGNLPNLLFSWAQKHLEQISSWFIWKNSLCSIFEKNIVFYFYSVFLNLPLLFILLLLE